MKEEIVKLINEKYKNSIALSSSSRTEVEIFVEKVDDVKPVIESIEKYLENYSITNFAVLYCNDKEKKFKIVFSVSLGWEDGIVKK